MGRAFVLVAVLCALPGQAWALDGALVERPQVSAGATTLKLLPARSIRLAVVEVPRVMQRRDTLRLGDRLRVSGRRVRVLRRSSAPTFARLDTLTGEATRSATEAAAALERVAALPVNIAGTDNIVAADQAEALRERLNLLDRRLGSLASSLDQGQGGVRRAFGARANRVRSLRVLRRRALRPLEVRIEALRAASTAIESGVYELDTRLSVYPTGPVELPIGTVGTLSELIKELLELLGGPA